MENKIKNTETQIGEILRTPGHYKKYCVGNTI